MAALEPDVRASRLMAAVLSLLVWFALGWAFPAFAGDKVALVVGEANYQHGPALPTVAADAADVASALTDLGFTTTLRTDIGKRQLDQSLGQFARDAKTADVAIFYYAGQGLQFAGRNYLAPVDAQAPDEAGVGSQLTAVEDVKAALNAAKGLKILILDACRDNPFAARLKRPDAPAVQGLARDEAATGMIIAFAAKADQTASDADGRNSPFTAALLKALKTPGLEVGALFHSVDNDLVAATGGAQSLELAMSATPEYYINPSETDQTVWLRIRNGRDVTALEDFIARFPKSASVPDAIARIELLESRKRIQADVAEAGDKVQPVRPREDAAAKPPERATAAPAPEAAKPDLTPAIADQLRRLGCFAGADADWNSPALQGALVRYARRAGGSVVGPDAALLETMKTQRAEMCRPGASAKVARRRVRKTCGAGAYPKSAGVCARVWAVRVRAVAPAGGGRQHAKPCLGAPKRCGGRTQAVQTTRHVAWPPFATSSSPPRGRDR